MGNANNSIPPNTLGTKAPFGRVRPQPLQPHRGYHHVRTRPVFLAKGHMTAARHFLVLYCTYLGENSKHTVLDLRYCTVHTLVLTCAVQRAEETRGEEWYSFAASWRLKQR
jgi:hypothetical protein